MPNQGETLSLVNIQMVDYSTAVHHVSQDIDTNSKQHRCLQLLYNKL